MQYTINQLYTHLYQKAHDVYGVFKDFFGEEYVDFQPNMSEDFHKHKIAMLLKDFGIEVIDDKDFDTSYEISDTNLQRLKIQYANHKVRIYVWWPNVTVTNENNRSIHIKDLYAKVEVTIDGRIPYENRGFGLNRATYTKIQFLSNYMHSHIEGIPKGSFGSFQLPCLGHGPIADTINTLKNEGDEITWMLFCQELAMYITVESLKGGPWRRLEEVGSYALMPTYRGYSNHASKDTFLKFFSEETLKRFIKYYLEEGHLSLSFKEERFRCGMPYYEYIIDISNTFIDFFNKYITGTDIYITRLKDRLYQNLLYHTIISNGKFYRCEDNNNYAPDRNIQLYRNQKVLTFKGKDILTTITEDAASLDNITPSTIIEHKFAMYVLQKILTTVNYRYRNEYYYNKYGINKNAPSYQRVIYI